MSPSNSREKAQPVAQQRREGGGTQNVGQSATVDCMFILLETAKTAYGEILMKRRSGSRAANMDPVEALRHE